LPLIIFEGISALSGAFSNLFQILEARRNVQGLTTTSEQESEFIMNPLATEVNIEFKDVVPVIDGIHLPAFSAKLEVGQTLVISGRSGIGKSSLISALLGFLPYTGEILINGELLNSKHQSLFTALLQDDYLFTTSIRENLKIGNPKASDRDLMQMLEIVELAELVHKLPVGLDTHIGSTGYNFSGGEKQRFKLARLLLRNTPCFILDEPYEFLDKFQADRIAKRIANVLHGKTVLIISHLQIPIVADFFVLNQEIS
jgi:ABC-type transport system involved in cytochrome bd biosynthesis fused ATPase/permease subunit